MKPSFLDRTSSFRKRNIRVFGLQEAQGVRKGNTRAHERQVSDNPHEIIKPRLPWGALEAMRKAMSEFPKLLENEKSISFRKERDYTIYFSFCFFLGDLLLVATLSPLGMYNPGRSWGHIS